VQNVLTNFYFVPNFFTLILYKFIHVNLFLLNLFKLNMETFLKKKYEGLGNGAHETCITLISCLPVQFITILFAHQDEKDKTQVLPTYEVFSLELHNKYTYGKEHEQ